MKYVLMLAVAFHTLRAKEHPPSNGEGYVPGACRRVFIVALFAIAKHSANVNSFKKKKNQSNAMYVL